MANVLLRGGRKAASMVGMSAFLNEDFLLSTEMAKRLYHEYAEPQPILDYHTHLSAAAIADDRRFKTSRKSGWKAITTSGAPCGPMELPSDFAPAKRHQRRNFAPGRAQCP